jgi:hypothetical protein
MIFLPEEDVEPSSHHHLCVCARACACVYLRVSAYVRQRARALVAFMQYANTYLKHKQHYTAWCRLRVN